MAITAYTGPPGSGKSHALVKDVVLSAVFAGRRVLSNVDGLNPDAILAYCLEREPLWQVDSADKLGQVVLFHGEDSKQPGFWPTEETEKAGQVTVIRPGDLVVFDEWAMFWPNGDKSEAAAQVEAFMRWHRHLTSDNGVACDLAIATQAITDFSRRHRPLLSRSYLFKKLTAVGAKGSYTWHVFDGKLQKSSYQTGTGRYDPAVFPLYASSAAASSGNHTELKTNKKETIWSGWRAWAVIVSPFLLLGGGAWGLRHVWTTAAGPVAPAAVSGSGGLPSPSGGYVPGAPSAAADPASPWRIVGFVDGDGGQRVIVSDQNGAVRVLLPSGFQFEDGRPVRGTVDGKTAVAQDNIPSAAPSMMAGVLGQ